MKNILVVSFNKELIEKIESILNPQGYEILHANTADEARDAIESSDRNIQFVLYDADIAMSGGMEILLYLKDRYPELPIITATAMHSDNGPLHMAKPESATNNTGSCNESNKTSGESS